jgi:signal transduction histidine kinase
MKLAVVLLIITVAFSRSIVAQAPATFQIRHYTTENGLPSNGMKGMAWDEQTGFLWVATEAGIVRFNGIDFKTYSNQNTSFIGTERIAFMTRNNQGAIYAVDLNNNILKIQQNNLVFQRNTPRFKGSFSPYLYGLIVSDTFLNQKIDHPGIISYSAFFTKMVSLTDTSMIAIDNGKAFLVSMSDQTPRQLAFVNISIKTCFRITDKLFFLDEINDIFLVDIAKQTLLPVPVHNDDRFAGKLNMNETFFSGENGYGNPIIINQSTAWELLYDGTEFTAKEICNAIPPNTLIRFAQYSEEKKLLFIGTASKGLIIISENAVVPIKKESENATGANAQYSQVELQNGDILTSEGDVIGPHQQKNEPLPVKGKFRFSAYTTADSVLWYSQQGNMANNIYLHCYDYITHRTTEYPRIPTGDNFVLAYSNHNVYIGTDEGFGQLRDDSMHYLFKGQLNPYSIAEDIPGTFIIASCANLIRFNTINNTADTMLSLPGNCIRTLWKFNDYLFIGTYGKGYYIYKNGRMKAMPLDKNNYLSHVHCFIADQYGYCWVSTNRGLFKSKLADLISAFEHENQQIYYHYFGRNDGMGTTEMNGGCTPCALQMKNETISFPTMDGLLWVNPKKAVTVLPYGNIYIDGIEVDNKKINPDSLPMKEFPSDTKEIQIQLGFSAWCNKENVYIDYDLNNSGRWKTVNIDKEAVIRLYGLPHGDYDLQVRKINGFGAKNYSYSELHFSINTPWYQQWWFYILMALVAIGLGSLYLKLRTRQYVLRQRKLERQVFEKTKELQLKNEMLEKNDTIKTRLISIISHDIITPLKFLAVAGKNLLQKKHLMSEEMQNETISEITNTSQDLQLLSTNILNWIKYQNENRRLLKENFNVHELVNQVSGILISLAKQKQLHLSNQIDKELIIYQYAEPLRILMHNLISNAINFSERGTIAITSRQEAGNLIISVKDDGIGMTWEQINNIMGNQVIITAARPDNRKGHGLGYLIIKDLVKMIGAELKIDSEKGKGTTVSIKMPQTETTRQP